VLAGLGYKQEFKRAFNSLEVFGLAFSIMGLLPSIASVLSSSVSNGGPVSMVWGWALGSCLILCVGMALGELASSAPTSGGLYYLTYILSSPRYRNVLCWLVGYANTIGTVTGIASINWGCTVQIVAAMNIGSNGHLTITNSQAYGIYALVILSQAVICSLGTRVLARLQTVYVIANVLLCLVVIIALPITTPKELKNSASYVFGNFTNLSGWPDGFSFLLGLLAPLWTISGYDAVIHISEESSNAATAAPWGIVSAIAIAGVLGWVINVILAFCMGPDLSKVIDSPVDQPMAQIFLNSFGQSWTLVLWSFIIIAQYMMGSSQILGASRQIFAFSRDGALPMSRLLYQMNAYTSTPVNAVVFACIFALVVGLLALLSSTAIDAAFTISVTAPYVAYMVPIISRFIFENNFKSGPFSLGPLGAPIAAIAVTFMSVMLVVLCFPNSPDPEAVTMNYTSVVLGGWMLFAAAWYYFPVYGGVHWFQGPSSNVKKTTSTAALVGSIQEETAVERESIITEDGVP